MAIVPMQKIRLFVHKGNKPAVLDFLQSKGVLHLTENEMDAEGVLAAESDEDTHAVEQHVAELDFATAFLGKYEAEKKGLQAKIDGSSVKTDWKEVESTLGEFSFKDVVARCQSVEEELNNLHHEAKTIHDTQAILEPWQQMTMPLDFPRETDSVTSVFATCPEKEWEGFKSDLLAISTLLVLECEMIKQGMVYAHIVVDHEFVTDVNRVIAGHKTDIVELPAGEGSVTEELERLNGRLKQIEEREGQLVEAAKGLAKDLRKLRIVYDTMNWKRHQNNARKHFVGTDSTLLITGWMPKRGVKRVREELADVTSHFELTEVEKSEGEVPPVLIRNRSTMQPFKAVTDIYGLPLYHEVDPTPFHALFFIIFFGMCLTDAGYGILMFASMWAALKYLDLPKSMKPMIRLLMYGGVFTFIMGVLFGGWFGLTPDQAPAWLTTVKADGSLKFIGQTFDALGNAMQVLILSLALGYLQVLFGVWINFIHKLRNIGKREAWLDAFPWTYTITAIGFLILSSSGVALASLSTVFVYATVLGAALIVLSRFIPSIKFVKRSSNAVLNVLLNFLALIPNFLTSLIALYDGVSYLSDVLSYSRLLALGLATAIIGMAVNILAGLVSGVPVLGIVFVVLILLVGHIFNIGINTLGSFIHSGRLQFVEFFGKFLEGGGSAFRPFARESKFVRFNK